MANVKKRWTPSHWASLKPFGIGEQRPNNFAEVFRAFAENRDQLGYAWRILTQGCCDGCALGTAGLRDWTLDGVHLCNIRLRLLRLNTMPAFSPSRLADVEPLRALSGEQLRDLGRIPYPMIRRKGDRGFMRISWDDALAHVAERIKATSPNRCGFYLTSRGMPNESYYMAQKAVRAIGSSHIDNAARVCHSPSTVALKASIGVAATTCSYTDWFDSDLIVFIGSNVANNQPVSTKYLHFAKKNGARIAVINTYREPGMERYWIPSVPESAIFGTKLADQFFLIHRGGDVAFLNGVMKHIVENGWEYGAFIEQYTTGFDGLRTSLERQPWETLERESGVTRETMRTFAEMVHDANKAVFVWSMGITQHTHGEDNVQAIVNLALLKGYVGREGCGLMPIRGHSGVQGGAEMGAYASAYPGGLAVNEANAKALSEQYGFEVPPTPGMTAPEMIDAAHAGELDLLFSAGGNFLDVMPDPEHVEAALSTVPLRIHMDIVLSSQMLVDPGDTVLLLPAATRYETAGGVTETSTERRVIFSPEIEGPRIGEARPEWEVFRDLALRVRPDLDAAFDLPDTQRVREEIARIVPMYDGIQHLKQAGEQFQYGGAHLCYRWAFPTPDGKAHFSAVEPGKAELPEGRFLLATRRGKQFNSMVQEKKDALNGAVREAVLMSAEDAERLGLHDGDAVVLRNNGREFRGLACIARIKPGNLQVHWPEGNVLLEPHRRSPHAGVPDYNAAVTVERIEA